jgi:FKBP-type peptidyl-prolyl cis-trans isomerase SlyD
MKITGSAFVAIDYALTLDSGEEIDRSEPGKPLGFIYGENQIIPGLENKLDGMEVGDNAKISVEPEDGYGAHRPELLQEFPKKNFVNQEGIEPGVVFQAHTPQGPINIRIVEVKDEVVIGDMNHPLAGERLNVDINVVEVREPTEEERDALKHHADCSSHQCQHCGGEKDHH